MRTRFFLLSAAALGAAFVSVRGQAPRTPAPHQPSSPPPGARYTFRIVAQTGQKIGDRIIQGFDARHGLMSMDLGPVINDDGKVAYVAATDKGPTIFLNEAVIADLSKQVSGRSIVNLGQPYLNNAKPPDVGYRLTYNSSDKRNRDGLAINGELKLPFPTVVDGCGGGPVVSVKAAAMNDSGSYAAFVTTGANVDCWVKDGVLVATKGSKIGAFQVGLLSQPTRASINKVGDMAFMAKSVQPGPTDYLCNIAACRPLPNGPGLGALGPIINSEAQTMYAIAGSFLMRGTDNAYFRVGQSPFYAMNDAGQVFNSYQVANWDDVAPKGNRQVEFIDTGYEYTGVPELHGEILRQIIDHGMGVSINNKGQIAFMINYVETKGMETIMHQALIVGTPTAAPSKPSPTATCSVPTYEESRPWGARDPGGEGSPDLTQTFRQYLFPEDPSFQGRHVRESTDSEGVDQCWDTMDQHSKRIAVTLGNENGWGGCDAQTPEEVRAGKPKVCHGWTRLPKEKSVFSSPIFLLEHNRPVWQLDFVGIQWPDRIRFIQKNAKLPCSITLHQVMEIECPGSAGGWKTYAHNTLVITIDANGQRSSRTPVERDPRVKH